MMPQLTMLGLLFLGLGINLAKHGEPKSEDYNFVLSLITTGISITILYYGGFWDVILN